MGVCVCVGGCACVEVGREEVCMCVCVGMCACVGVGREEVCMCGSGGEGYKEREENK